VTINHTDRHRRMCQRWNLVTDVMYAFSSSPMEASDTQCQPHDPKVAFQGWPIVRATPPIVEAADTVTLRSPAPPPPTEEADAIVR
jgi:hypothetical protein